MTRWVSLVATLGLAGTFGWWLRPVSPSVPPVMSASALHVPVGTAPQASITEPCPEVDCERVQERAVRELYEALAATQGGPPPVPWPVDVLPSEAPDQAEARIGAWADRCLPEGAFLSVNCDEYPCVFGYDVQQTPPGCDAPWSELDVRHDAASSEYDVRFVIDEPLAEDSPVRARLQGRINQVVRDGTFDHNARED